MQRFETYYIRVIDQSGNTFHTPVEIWDFPEDPNLVRVHTFSEIEKEKIITVKKSDLISSQFPNRGFGWDHT